MTYVCFDITKVQCQKLNIIGYFFSISYMLVHGLLKRKICKEKKKKKNALNMIASVYSRRCRSYKMYLEGDSPHQIGSNAIQTSFPRSLSIYPCLFTSQTLYSFSKPLPQEIFGLNQVLLHLVSV